MPKAKKGTVNLRHLGSMHVFDLFWESEKAWKGMKRPLHSVWKSSNNKRLTHHWEQEGLDSQQLRSKPSANFRRLSAPFASGLPWSHFMSLVGWASFALSWWSDLVFTRIYSTWNLYPQFEAFTNQLFLDDERVRHLTRKLVLSQLQELSNWLIQSVSYSSFYWT